MVSNPSAEEKNRACHLKWLLLCSCVALMDIILDQGLKSSLCENTFAAVFVNLAIRRILISSDLTAL